MKTGKEVCLIHHFICSSQHSAWHSLDIGDGEKREGSVVRGEGE